MAETSVLEKRGREEGERKEKEDEIRKERKIKKLSWSTDTKYSDNDIIISHHTLFYLEFGKAIYRVETSNRIYRGAAICCITIHNGNSIYYNTDTADIPKNLLTYALRTSMENSEFLYHTRSSIKTEKIKFDKLLNESTPYLCTSKKQYLRGIVYTATENEVIDLLDTDNIAILKHNVGGALAKIVKVARFVKKWILKYQVKKIEIESIKAKLAQYAQDCRIKSQPLLRRLQKSKLLREFTKLEEDMIKFVKNKIEDAQAEEQWMMTLNDKNAIA